MSTSEAVPCPLCTLVRNANSSFTFEMGATIGWVAAMKSRDLGIAMGDPSITMCPQHEGAVAGLGAIIDVGVKHGMKGAP